MSFGLLFVDDEPDVEDLVRQNFRAEVKAGKFDLFFASDGVDALNVLKKTPAIKLVFTDINMPRMDGLTLLKEMVQLPETMTTVVVSAYGDMKNIRKAMNTGAFDFLTKPLDFTDFKATLEKAIAHVLRLDNLEGEKATAVKAQAMLARHFSPSVAEHISDDKAIPGHAERREASFLFSDIQGFLALLENLEPEQVVSVLNEYLENVVNIIFKYSGTVMKIIGDSVHATFGAPTSNTSHANDAVAAATEIDRFAREFSAQKQAMGIAMGKTRIGVHTGEAIFGNFGSSRYFDYSAYGDAVNVASRLEQSNKVFGTNICVSGETVSKLDNFRGRPIGELILRGKSLPILGFEPVSKELMEDAKLEAYCAAYQLIKDKSPDARVAFASLISSGDQDALAMFHLARLLDGVHDQIIRV